MFCFDYCVLSKFFPSFVHCWWLFYYLYLIVVLVHGPGFLQLLDLLSFLGVETMHKQGIEKRSVFPVVKGILGGVLKGLCSSCSSGERRGHWDWEQSSLAHDSKFPFSEITRRIHKCGDSESFWAVNTGRVVMWASSWVWSSDQLNYWTGRWDIGTSQF